MKNNIFMPKYEEYFSTVIVPKSIYNDAIIIYEDNSVVLYVGLMETLHNDTEGESTNETQ